MTDLSCEQCREVAPELALGLVTGRERADAVVHLQSCAACRAHVAGLTRLHDELRALIPTAEPPIGFESRALDRRGAAAAPGPAPRRRWRVVVAAIVAAGLLFGVGWAAAVANAPSTPVLAADEQAVLFAPLTAAGREVGQVYVHPGSSTWIYLYLEVDRAAPEPLTCVVLRRDGTRAIAAQVPVVDDDAFWGGPVAFERDDLAEVHVVDSAGTIRAAAHFYS